MGNNELYRVLIKAALSVLSDSFVVGLIEPFFPRALTIFYIDVF